LGIGSGRERQFARNPDDSAINSAGRAGVNPGTPVLMSGF
jgi:hypothetical protein